MIITLGSNWIYSFFQFFLNQIDISVQTRGELPNSAHHTFSLGCCYQNLPDLKNGQVYYILIIYDAELHQLQVQLSDSDDNQFYIPILTIPFDHHLVYVPLFSPFFY